MEEDILMNHYTQKHISTSFTSFTGSHISIINNPINYISELCILNQNIYKMV